MVLLLWCFRKLWLKLFAAEACRAAGLPDKNLSVPEGAVIASPPAAPGPGAISKRTALHLEHLTLEMLAYGRQKPAFSHFVARVFKKILAEQLPHFIR